MASTAVTGREPEGFTLIETLLALALVGIGVLAVAPMFVLAIQGNAASADVSTAGALAVERMEWSRAQDYFAMVAGGSLTTNVSGYCDLSRPGYVVRWQVRDNVAPVLTKTIQVRAIALRQVVGEQKQVTVSLMRGR